jgi:hypothetical protein
MFSLSISNKQDIIYKNEEPKQCNKEHTLRLSELDKLIDYEKDEWSLDSNF